MFNKTKDEFKLIFKNHGPTAHFQCGVLGVLHPTHTRFTQKKLFYS
jgi:hypothetical protein